MNSLFHEQCYANGKWFSSQKGRVTHVFNPYDQNLIGSIPTLEKDEITKVINDAHAAFNPWKSKTAKERSAILLKWYELILSSQDTLAQLLTQEQGKSITEARAEIQYGASFIQWFAEEAKRAYGDIIPQTVPNQRLLVIKQALGVVAAITPWNFPVAMITRKCAPALAAGCPVIIKPSSLTPFSALALADLAQQAGIPKGVFNIVTGEATLIAKLFCENPLVKKISFTGSTLVGQQLAEEAAKHFKKVSLELGGNAPFIVFNDANLDEAVEGAILAKFRNSGQTCVCANRFLLQKEIAKPFTKKFIEKIKALPIGNGLNETTRITTLINEAAIQKLEALLKDATKKGAKLLLGGNPASQGRYFFEPTVLVDVTSKMDITRQEIFGPIVAISEFNTIDEALTLANNTEFGLAAYFYSKNIETIFKVAENLEYGIVGVNSGIISNEVSPFGGIKHSGTGREGSKYGLDEYLEIKYICLGELNL